MTAGRVGPLDRLPGVPLLGTRQRPDGVVEIRTAERLPLGPGHDGAGVLRCSMRARSPEARVVGDLPTLHLDLPAAAWEATWFASQWGDEFSPRRQAIDGPLSLGVRTGRSSNGTHPWVCLSAPGHGAVVVVPAWSGNWSIDVAPAGGDDSVPGALVVTAGVSPWRFARTVHDDRPFHAPPVYLAWGSDRAGAAAALAAAVDRWVVPTSPWTDALPVEWNHWWPYEDAEIDADTFVANAAVAHELGLDVATLDAGWFGSADAGTFWERERGDWDRENTVRFPQGLLGLAQRVERAGPAFGLWIEAEAVGPDARIRRERTEIQARRDDDPPDEPVDPTDPGWLGYVCLGSPDGRQHVRETLERLVTRTGARWLKLDFNLDPGAGCSRTDHGHDAGDGLYEHYVGLYAILDELRAAHPELLVEACSSGGLRIDLGLLARVHCAFLSDPDWTEFHLQLLWGACQMLPARAVLHWSESQWRGFHPCQHLDLASLDEEAFDHALRAVMLHRFGVSYRLVDLSPALRARLTEHLAVYREMVAPVIRCGGVLRPLTPQPLRQGGGERFPAFRLDGARATVLAAFRLAGAPDRQRLVLHDAEPGRRYRLVALGPGSHAGDVPALGGAPSVELDGAVLAAGLDVVPRGTATSWLLRLDPVPPHPHAGGDTPS